MRAVRAVVIVGGIEERVSALLLARELHLQGEEISGGLAVRW